MARNTKDSAPVSVPAWSADKSFEYTYPRKSGDIQCFANNKEEAVAVLKQHGFTDIDPSKLVQTGRTIKQFLASDTCALCNGTGKV